ncbi:nonribosomal peptide synthetase 8 [Corynespora cassiicola Philippines]|uniref:Nonribosomal peptide synthetase 8 n=1 Tax=Corynespora cassiicola Philippines TaxID=1448308 RepID=A0A2T2N596_CORCC|nr:nonribosomal peptide synthetase 8 [Corynespora cassiicola Philippines]
MEGYLHPDTIAITLYYRRGYISREVAEEVCTVLCWAADFFIESAAPLDSLKGTVGGTESVITLPIRFCKYLTGNHPSDVKGFWNRYLSGVEGLSSKTRQYESADGPKRDEVTLHMPPELEHEFSLESIAQVAWAVFLAQENESDEVFFGITAKRNRSTPRPVPGLDGSKAAFLPCRMKLPPQATVGDLLKSFQQLEKVLGSNESPGLHWLRQIHPSADCFTTAIILQSDNLCDNSSMETIVRLETSEDRHVFHLTSYRNAPVQRISQRFIHILRQLCRKENLNTTWSAVIGICEEENEEIQSWNSSILPTSDQTVHNLFSFQVRKRPEATAICAWDGSLTYRQLDKYSTWLAFHLLDQNIQPGSILVLCFEKSLLMPISMLAVAKAGITGLSVDPNQPESRLANVVSESKAAAILCSGAHRDLSGRLGTGKVLFVGLDTVSGAQQDGPRSLPTVPSSAILYAVFTSGSTGRPKGILVSHRSYSAAAVCQHEPFGFNQETRVLDFSSYAFDAAWFNLMHTVTSGGCLCVPSTVDLRNDLEGCISRFGVSLAFLTPTVCRGIDRRAFFSLKRLLLGGEMIVPSDIALIGGDCIITLVYGPSECTPMTMFHNPENPADIALGHGIGVKTWIVSPDNVQQLCPIGVIGELCLEGSLLGDGYLGDKTKTEQAFIKGLSWHPDSQAQVYRTGDLVKYIGDELGTIVCIGRKDTQVKLRGQRVELGEVEQHIHDAILASTQGCQEKPILQIAAEVVRSEETKNVVLVAFVSLKTEEEQSEADYQKAVRQLTADVSVRLEQQVPSYMIPVSYIPLPSIPTTITGKTDRVHLRATGARLWREFTTQNDQIETESSASEDPTERMLQQIWSEVLNLPIGTVPTTKGFTSLGGDSITAMQVVSRCRKQGVALTVADILLARTIRSLAPRCCSLPSTQQDFREDDDSTFVVAYEQNEESFELSPIQQRFFQIFPDGEDHFNQCFILEVDTSVSKHELQEALRAILDRHSMLRARYHRSSQGVWSQHVTPSQPWDMAEYTVSRLSEAFSVAQEMQKQLSIVDGPVFSAVYFTVTDHKPLLLLSAHHLVIDLVSWRIVWRDLEDFIKHKRLLSVHGTSFRRWCKEQNRKSRDFVPDSVLPFVIPTPNILFWGCSSEDQVRSNAIDSTMTLDSESSKLLMGGSNDAMRTEPLDIILGALAYSFGKSFPERSIPTMFLEGHGREALGHRVLDVSDTVGWFTTIHPLALATKADNTVIDAVCLAKDARRLVPGKGQPYFASRFYSEKCMEAFKEHDAIELLINFAGSYQQLESDTGLFKLVPFLKDEEAIDIVAPSSPRLSLIELSMMIRNSQLELTMTVNKHMLYQDRLSMWQARFLETIRDAATALSCFPAKLTGSDVPLLSLTEAALWYLNDVQLPAMGVSPKEVIDAYPASPLQEGVLLSADQGLSTYDTFWIWKCLPQNGEEKVKMAQLAEAWRSVVRKHSILSTVFAPAPGGEGFIQLVLSEPEIKVTCLEVDDQDPEDVLYQLQRPLWVSQGLPRHLFTIYQCGTKTACRLDINHALIDGGSLMPLVEDLQMAYTGVHFTAAPRFGEMIKYLTRSNRKKHVDWWARYLHGVKPCEVHSVFNRPVKGVSHDNERFRYLEVSRESTAGVYDFCKRVGITRSVFLQAAWAMVLSYLTDASDVCFGYLTSGRDAPIQHVDRMIGPLANMLISKIELDEPVSAVLQQISDDSSQHLLHQHVSLARIQHTIGLKAGQRLFNTAMTLRESDRFGENDAHSKVSFEYHNHQDPHEFVLLLSARINANDLDVSVQLPQDLLDAKTAEKLVSALSSAIYVLLSSDTPSCPSVDGQQNEETLFTTFKRRMVDSASQRDLNLIWSWNTPLPEPIQRCVHDEIRAVALRNWNQPAVCAWDGDLSYGQLEEMSIRVANDLRAQGIGCGNIVPVCFEKSMWMPIAALGVMKAGAAVVALDVTLPEKRLQDIIKQIQSDIILSSVAQRHLAGRLGATKVHVLPNNDQQSGDSAKMDCTVKSSPEDLLYIVFTSGSTGTPKGTMLTHAHVCSMLHYQSEVLGLTSASRVYNFASYAFDVAWDDFFFALTSGGCLCIPSEEDRKNDIEASMAVLRANYAHITPTILRHINWTKAASICVVNLSGEPVSPTDRSILSHQTKVVNVYGPAETNIVTVQDLDKLTTQEVSIGKGFGACTWIVDLQNTDVLVPIGEIGELWVEGPLSGLEYLVETTDSRKAWVDDPIWLAQGTKGFPGRSGRLYRTGDLVRYTEDGSIIYCGRADRQIKINGQRVELGEIEVALQTVIKELGHDWRVAVEIAQPLESDLPVIMAFIAPVNANFDEKELRSHIMQEANLLRKQLGSVLPQFMVPRAFVPLTVLPLTPTGKVNLRELQAYGSSKSIREWTSDEQSSIETGPAVKESEKAIVRLCEEVLQFPETISISMGDNFFCLGGDSIFAMRLVSKARESGYSLTVRDIFQNPVIADLAKIARLQQSANELETTLVADELLDNDKLRANAASICNIREEQIVDILPCTPLQRNVASWAIHQPKGQFRTTHQLEVKQNIDIHMFKQCWDMVAKRNPIMRTRVVDLPGRGYTQIVVDETPEWIQRSTVEECQQELVSRQMLQGERFVNFALAQDSMENSVCFLWDLHWAAYDGWSLRLLLAEAENLYHGRAPDPLNDMRVLTNSLCHHDSTKVESYWTGQFSSLTAASLEFPRASPNSTSIGDHDCSTLLSGFGSQSTGFTATTLIRAGLAIVLARHLRTDRVVFGATVTGRQGATAGLDRVAGPLFATLPVCVSVDSDNADTHDLLEKIQLQTSDMIPFEQTDLEYYRHLISGAGIACDFKVLLVVQSHIPRHDPRNRNPELESIFTDGLKAGKDALVELGWRSGRRLPMLVECQLQETGDLMLRLRVDSETVDRNQFESLLQQLKREIWSLSKADSSMRLLRTSSGPTVGGQFARAEKEH